MDTELMLRARVVKVELGLRKLHKYIHGYVKRYLAACQNVIFLCISKQRLQSRWCCDFGIPDVPLTIPICICLAYVKILVLAFLNFLLLLIVRI